MARGFAASSDTVQMANAMVNGVANVTVCGWFISPSSASSQQGGFMNGTDNGGFGLLWGTGQVQIFDAGIGFHNVTGETFTFGQWNHLAIVTDVNSKGTVYLNGGSGVFVNNALNAPASQLGIEASIGHEGTGNMVAPAGGAAADVAAWNVSLTAAEVGALAAGARPGAIRSANLKFWMPLNGVASPEPDLSGNKNTGTLTGTVNASGPPLMQFTPRWPQFNAVAAATFNPSWAMRKNIIVEGYAT